MKSDRTVAASHPPPPPLAPPLNGSNNAFPQVRPMHGRTSGPTRRSTRGQWTPEEDEILRKAVQSFKGRNWKKIAECFKDRTDVQCLHRWQKVLNPELVKGPWSKEEDEIIVQLVDKYGPTKWSTIAQHLPGRIGKQCRERWHNHLNPCINKEAWTQEEELVLIRAHQVHGNRWAELTKYLPGRTDNAIKNHWNSSVKKKLDSYIASGLLAQFQGLPLVSYQSPSIPASPMFVQQSSGDGSVFKDGSAEAEHNSECSQVLCSQTASDMSNTVGQAKDDLLLPEDSDHGKLQTTNPPASCSEHHYESVEDITFIVHDNFARNHGPCEADMPSIELAEDTSFQGNYYIVNPINDSVPGPSYHSIDYDAFASANNVTIISDTSGQNQMTEEGCSEPLIQNERNDGGHVNFTYCSNIIDMDRFRDYISFQTQLSDSGDIALPSKNPLDASVETSNFGYQIKDSVALSEMQEISNVGVPCDNHIDVGSTEQTDITERSRLVAVNTFLPSEPSGNHQTHSNLIERPTDAIREQDAGSLCYQPPQFPSLDTPFFCCDLAQTDSEVQQEFSPLGIRQLMMSTKLWDSPSSYDSPDAVLKTAAKTFACTPSILKKRHRDLLSSLSPFSERQLDKKTGRNMKQGLIDCKEPAPPSPTVEEQREDKENIYPVLHAHEQSEKSVREEESETPKGVLVERHLSNAQFSSPDGAGHKARSETGDVAVEVWSLKNTCKPATFSESMACKAKPFLSPSFLSQKKQINDSAVASGMVDGLVNEIGAENLNFFGGTPFRRSIESPSAWKSPWYFSPLVNCPRIDTELTVEDIGIFTSPGGIRFDAIGLMKQINEQSASAYADAREVLGSETPESILRQRCLRNKKLEVGSLNFVDSMMSNSPAERRVLDFSECESPAKPTENGEGAIPASVTSPSLCLLKSYR